MDPYYNYRMWVELYNIGDIVEDQGVYYFTDDLSQPKQWKPLSKEIPAKGFSVIWFERSGEEDEDELEIEINNEDWDAYANFTLNHRGGTLYLLNEKGNIVDQVLYPAQYRNVSYGRWIDGEDHWVFFVEHSIGASNNGMKHANAVCKSPLLTVAGGFYQGDVKISFYSSQTDEKIYYTTDGSEPNINSIQFILGEEIILTKTTCLRAVSISDKKIPSNVVTTTYFVNERDFNLPVVSIVTNQRYLFDDMIGMYTEGTNGALYKCSTYKLVNYVRDWFRPANFELFDTRGQRVLCQELDITINGGCSRAFDQKSLKIKPRHKFGDNNLHYDFFSAQKPNHSYKDILLRQSANDWSFTMMRDGFIQTLVTNRMDVDHQAYEPAVLFLNGEYYGIQNLREVHSKDYLFSNYGLNEEQFYLLRTQEIRRDPEFLKFSNYILNNDISNHEIYEQVIDMIDIDSFVEYWLAQIYWVNTDWPHGNFEVWKKKESGKWRWILYDTDFGFWLTTSYTDNFFNRLERENAIWHTRLYHRLILNNVFRNKFLHKFCIHLSSTFATNRVDSIMDNLASRISTEIVYHKTRWGHAQNFDSEIAKMKDFSAKRPDYVYQHIGERFFPTTETRIMQIRSNINKAKYQFFTEAIIDNKIDLRYFKDQPIEITPDKVAGYQFKHWEYTEEGGGEVQILTEPKYDGILTQNIFLKAIYEKVDDDPLKIYINEISGNDNWLEIYSDENEPVHLTGFNIHIIDNEGEFVNWTIPPGTIIDAKGFKVFTVGIRANRDVAFRLFDNEGWEIDFFEVKMIDNLYSIGDNRTVGRQTDGDPNLIVFLNGGTKGYSNNNGAPQTYGEGAGKRIYINEISGNDKWLELYNDEDEPVDLTGYTIRKIDDVNSANDWTVPAGTIIPAKGFKTWTQYVDDGFTWGITAHRDVSFKLFDDEWREIDFFEVRMADDLYTDGDRRTVGRQTDGHLNLIVFLNGGTKNYSNRLGISETHLSEEDPFSELKVYPNPFTGEIRITGVEGSRLQVISTSGAVMHTQRITSSDEIIRVEHLSAGMYLFRVEKKGRVKTVQVIKI